MLGVPPQQFLWSPDYQLMSLCVRPLGTLRIKRGKEYKRVKDPRMLKRERLHTLPSNPLPRKPELLRLSKRRVLPLGPPKELKGNYS